MHPALSELPAWASPWPGNQILYGLPESQYHGTKALVSKSALDKFDVSPLHYRYSLDEPQEAPTEALLLGSAFHVLVLEPSLYRRKVAILPNFGTMHSPKNRELRDAWIADEGRGRTILTQPQHDQIAGMAESVRAHPGARKLLAHGEAEVTAMWADPETGLFCKSRADWLCSMRGVFVDLKSAIDASPRVFRRAAADRRYHVQDAFYSRAFEENGVHIEHFVFVVVEKDPPYAVACYELDHTARMKGEEVYMQQLRDLRDCIDANFWPGYGDDVMNLSLPPWATVLEAA